MLRTIAVIAMAALLTIGIFGCSKGNLTNPLQTEESQLDKNWGRSYETAKHNQTLNPDAGKNQKPVEGLQGPAAERIMEGYIKGSEQTQKKQPPVTEYGVTMQKSIQ